MKYFYLIMLIFSLICLFLAVANSLSSWLAAIYAICFVGMIIKRMKNKKQYPYPNILDKKMKHKGFEQLMFKLIIVSIIAIIVVLFVRLSYLKYIKQDLEQELDELEHKQKMKKGETKI